MTNALPTRDDYFQIGANEVLSRSQQRPQAQRISREAVFTEGTDINIIIAACSAMADEGTRQLALRMAALHLDSAEREDLDRLVADRFSPTVVRHQPTRSVVEVSFSRAVPPSNGAPISYPIGTKVRTQLGVEYALTEAASFGPGSTGPVVARAQATLAGSAGNVAAGTITQFVGANQDQAVVITNPEPASGGRDTETDESLRRRARAFYISARRGTLPAIEFGALTVSGVESASASEVLDSYGVATGIVQLTIADKNGQANQVLADAVRLALREWRAGGIVVDVVTSVPSFQSIAYSVAFRDGVDQRKAVSQIKALTLNAVNLLAPNEPLQRSLLFAIARSVPGVVVLDSSVAMPLGDVFPAQNETIKTSLERITVNGL